MFRNKKKGFSNIVYDFRLRAPYFSYRTLGYNLYPKLEETEMMPKLKKYINKLFACSVDCGNCDALDEILFSPAREALPELNLQHLKKMDQIRLLIVRRKADAENIRKIRYDRLKEFESIKADYEEICNKIKKNEV